MPKSQIITQKIIEIRGYKVLLDFDLAELYETEIELHFATPIRLKARVLRFIKH